MLLRITADRYVNEKQVAEVRQVVETVGGVPVTYCDIYLVGGGVVSVRGREAAEIAKQLNDLGDAPAAEAKASEDLKASGLAGVLDNVQALLRAACHDSVPLDELDAPIDFGGLSVRPSELVAVIQPEDEDGRTVIKLTDGEARVTLSITQVLYRLTRRLASAVRKS